MKIKQKNKRYTAIIISSIILLLVLAGLGYYFISKNNNKNGANTTTNSGLYDPSVNNPSTDVPKSNNTEGQSTNSNPATKGPEEATPSKPDSSVIPSTPTGSFISNHNPSLSDKAQDSETSTCSTTAGVSCQITFNMGNTTLSLPTQTTNASGNTSWNWSLVGMKFTAGTWNVSVIASNGSKISTSTDTMAVGQ